MAAIKKLSDALIDQIAAGEVVDRPASVVKELTENAIDAGASKVEVRLLDGGIRSIWIKDDGQGMTRDDLLACTDRHATSKVAAFEDLYSLATMGFRGEALASIAAVSDFTVRSRHAEADEGHQLTVSEGQKSLSDWSGSVGTAVTVAQLFSTVPARRKFLKKPAAEYLACLETLTALALAHPGIAMSLHHQDKMVFSYPQSSLEERIERVWKAKLQGKGLLALSGRHDLVSVEGFISPPGLERGTGKDIYTFVNGRFIKDQKLRYAVLRGYHSHLLKGRFPMVVLRLTVDPSLVDVNVSPAKTEVRLQYSDEMTAFISGIIKDKIREGRWAAMSFDQQSAFSSTAAPSPSLSPAPSTPNPTPSGGSGATFELPTIEVERAAPIHGATRAPISSPNAPASSASRAPSSSGSPLESDLQGLLGSRVTVKARSSEPAPTVWQAATQSAASAAPLMADAVVPAENGGEGHQFSFQDLRFVGTFFECYLAYEYGNRLLFIDQHAFHERILFEKLRGQHEAMLAPQPLLIAEGCTLNPEAVQAISEARSVLAKMGIDVVAQGAECVEVRALPALLHRADPAQVMVDVASILASYDDISAAAEEELTATLYHDLYSTIACHSAIRSGETLAEQDRLQLEREASGVDFYFNCPHGRRVFKWIGQSEVAGWFDRT